MSSPIDSIANQTDSSSNRATLSENKIKLLPEHLIDQIKAGEVIERPSSLLKELIENSIDAGADKIDIQLINNGLDLISIQDNGHGMACEDLPFAFCRHATSKILKFEDLYNLYSFGFRGEALASIASSSKLSCLSITRELIGGKIEIEGGKQTSLIEKVGNQQGTSIFIKDLFYNTPARLKFIKSQQSEKNSLNRIMNSFVLAHPQIDFSIRWDNKEKIVFKANPKLESESRVKKIFFKNKKKHLPLHFFKASYEGNNIHGYLSKESSKGASGKSQYLFANGRFFQDRVLHQAVIRSAKNLWGEGYTGHYAIFIDTPVSELDVNVHPNKIQIKFFKSTTVSSLLSSAIEKSLKSEKSSNPSFQERQPKQNETDNIPSGHNNFLEKTHQSNFEGILLSNQFGILKIENDSILIDLYKLYDYFWTTLEKKIKNQKESISPLLIGEPFERNVKFDQFFKYFLNLGIEFERNDSNLIIAKTIPSRLNGFNLHNFINPLMSYKAAATKIDLRDYLREIEAKCFSSPTEIYKLYSAQNIKDWPEFQISAQINDSNISIFFNE